MKKCILILSLFLSVGSVQGEEEAKATKDRIGPGKAVTSASEKEGFKLSEKAKWNLNLSVESVAGQTVTVPKKSLVSFLDFLAVYRLRDGWYRSIEVEPTIEGDYATFSSKEFRAGDQVVVENSGLLRVVELDVFGPEADACADGN